MGFGGPAEGPGSGGVPSLEGSIANISGSAFYEAEHPVTGKPGLLLKNRKEVACPCAV